VTKIYQILCFFIDCIHITDQRFVSHPLEPEDRAGQLSPSTKSQISASGIGKRRQTFTDAGDFIDHGLL
jgi:hypothetical protein